MNLASLIEPHPADDVAIISRGRATTFGELRDQVGHLRGGLVGLGLEPGDRIGIICANNWYFVASYLAALGAGLVAVPLNPLSPRIELERELAAIGARAVIVGPSAQQHFVQPDPAALPALELVIHSRPEAPGDGVVALADLLGADPVPIVERNEDDLAVLIFTSGTAGSPKAAMLSHGNLLANIAQARAADLDEERDPDVILGVLPMFHIFGLNVMLGMGLSSGSTVLLIERFDPVAAIEAIANHGVTVIFGAPTMWSTWAPMPGIADDAFAGVRRATSGAARLPPEVGQQMRDRFGLELFEGYGLTEASPVVTTSAGLPWHPGSIGVPLPGVDVRLVDADGEDTLVGDSGEIWVHGPNVFQGYWNDPEASRAALTEDRWLRTGDIAVVDDDGFLYLVDRAKDLIIVSGFNVFPAEVEEVIAEHPAVETAAVVGVAHPHSGEAVRAYVVVRDGASVEEDDIIEFCAARLARYKCPAKVMFVDQLPQNASGKVLRRALI